MNNSFNEQKKNSEVGTMTKGYVKVTVLLLAVVSLYLGFVEYYTPLLSESMLIILGVVQLPLTVCLMVSMLCCLQNALAWTFPILLEKFPKMVITLPKFLKPIADF